MSGDADIVIERLRKGPLSVRVGSAQVVASHRVIADALDWA